MTSIGETLRRERMRRNLDLNQISRETKIAARLLEAIEAEQFDKLPGGVFAKSFVRQYARVLGLDEDELAAEMDRTLQPEVPALGEEPSREAEPEITVPRVEDWQAASDRGFRWSSSLPALAGVVVVMLVCSGVYTWWQRSRIRQVTPPEPPAVAQTTKPAAAAAQQPVAPEQPAGTPAVAETPKPPTGQPAAESTTPPPAGATGTTEAQPEPAGQTQPPQPDRAQPPVAAGAANQTAGQPPVASPPASPEQKMRVPEHTADPSAPVRVQLTAAEATWISVRADGKYILSGILQPNETRTVGGNGTVQVRVGNAAGVNFALNGKPVGAVGPKGQVRTVQFTSGGFQIVPPAPRPPKPSVDLSDPL